MADLFLCLIILVCSGIDFYMTKSIVSKLGISAELNPLIRFLMTKLGLVPGLLVGIGAPTLVGISLLTHFHLTEPLSFIAGARTMLAILQVIRKKTFGF